MELKMNRLDCLLTLFTMIISGWFFLNVPESVV